MSNEDPYRAAHELVKKGQFEKALKEYQRLAQENPTHDFAWLKLGDLYLQKGYLREGAEAYLKAAELYGSSNPEKAAKLRATVQALLEPLQNQENERAIEAQLSPASIKKSSTARVLVLHGPNLQLLGRREVSIYGQTTLEEINQSMLALANELGLELDIHQSNHEGVLLDLIGEALGLGLGGMIINPGGYTHTSIALRDAISALGVFTVEIHLSNVFAREDFRKVSYISGVVAGVISGFGPSGYLLALRSVAQHLQNKNNASNHT